MKIKKGFVLEQVGDSYLAVATGDLAAEFHALVRMNSTGAYIWNLLKEDTTAEAIVSSLIAAYDVPREIAERDVFAFVKVLNDRSILE